MLIHKRYLSTDPGSLRTSGIVAESVQCLLPLCCLKCWLAVFRDLIGSLSFITVSAQRDAKETKTKTPCAAHCPHGSSSH